MNESSKKRWIWTLVVLACAIPIAIAYIYDPVVLATMPPHINREELTNNHQVDIASIRRALEEEVPLRYKCGKVELSKSVLAVFECMDDMDLDIYWRHDVKLIHFVLKEDGVGIATVMLDGNRTECIAYQLKKGGSKHLICFRMTVGVRRGRDSGSV